MGFSGKNIKSAIYLPVKYCNFLYAHDRGIIKISQLKGDIIMSFARGPKEPVPEVDTNVWSCTSDECQGWMRESYSLEEEPKCPLCDSEMVKEVRVLPELK